MKTITRLPPGIGIFCKDRRSFLGKVFSSEYAWFNVYLTEADRTIISHNDGYDTMIHRIISSDTALTKYNSQYTRKDLFDIAGVLVEYLPDIVSVENKLLPIQSLGFIIFYILEYMQEQGTYVHFTGKHTIKNIPGSQVNLLTTLFLSEVGLKSPRRPPKRPTKGKGLRVSFAPLPEAHDSNTFKRLRSKLVCSRRVPPRKDRKVQTYDSEEDFFNSWRDIVARFLRTDITRWGNPVDTELYNKIQVTMTYARVSYVNNWKNPAIEVPIL